MPPRLHETVPAPASASAPASAPAPESGGDALITRKEAADYLRVSVRWLEGCPDIPRVDLARPSAKRATIRYRKSDLDAYIASRMVAPLRMRTG